MNDEAFVILFTVVQEKEIIKSIHSSKIEIMNKIPGRKIIF